MYSAKVNRQKLISAVDNALRRHTASIMAKEPDVISSISSQSTHPSQTKFSCVVSNKEAHSCVIEPNVQCVHCGYCESLGH